MNRRGFLKSALGVLAGLAAGQLPLPAPEPPPVRPAPSNLVREDVRMVLSRRCTLELMEEEDRRFLDAVEAALAERGTDAQSAAA